AANGGGTYRKACLMVRASLATDAARVMVCFVPDHPPGPALYFDTRLTDGATPVDMASINTGIALPVRVAIVRRGDVVTVSYLTTAGEWLEPLGALGNHATVALGTTPLIGLSTTAYDTVPSFSVDFDDWRLCHPSDGGGTPGDPPVCTPGQPLDIVYLLDLSQSMDADFPGADPGADPTKLGAAKLALERLHDQIELRGDGSRAALLTFWGVSDDPQANLTGAVQIEQALTNDLPAVGAAIDGINALSRPGLTTTPSALAVEAIESTLAATDPSHKAVLVWLTDGVPNIDRDGRGHLDYVLDEIQAIDIRDGAGDFLPWPTVAWRGRFNQAYGTFDGETLANTMFALDRVSETFPDLAYYGIGIQGSGTNLGTFLLDLVDYGAWTTGGISYGPATHDGMRQTVDDILGDLACGGPANAAVGDRLWNDLDGDGVQDLGEPGVSQVTVELLDTADQVLATTTTDGTGAYLFTDVTPGDYHLRVDGSSLPGGLDQATHDFDGIATLDRAAVSLVAWEIERGVDFGYRASTPATPVPPVTVACSADDFADGVIAPAWQLATIGDADNGGADEIGGQLELSSNGTSFWGDDNVHFFHQTVSGDFRVEVDLTGVPLDPGGDPLRKAGLMIRKDLTLQSPRIMINLLPDTTDPQTPILQFGYRSTAGGQSFLLSNAVGNVQLPIRLAIEKRGDDYSAWYSTDDGVTWQQQTAGGANGSVTLDLGTTPLVGVAGASYDDLAVMTTAFDNFAVCGPVAQSAPVMPPAPSCDAQAPLDVVALLDLSASMTTAYPGGPSRLEAAQQALDQLITDLGARADGSRLALVTYAGGSDPATNLSDGARVLAGLTSDLTTVSTLVDDLDVATIDAGATTTAIQALRQLDQVLGTGADPSHKPVAIWLTDELPNVDLLGRGPFSGETTPLDFVLADGNGDYLAWTDVAWQGPFFGAFAAFAGEPVANAMAEIDALDQAHPDLRIFSLALQGDGTAAPVFDEDLLGYAAWYTAAGAYSADNLTDLLLATAQLWTDATTCTP
ncbi:MAG: SdrD B-like domain-containing protein, partial [Acidobacteriota bacterium]